MHFTKMHGLGNDYLYVYGEVPDDIAILSQKLSDRHFGAGSDGMIYISPSRAADFRMRIFNADGSEAKMCGNGIRCVGKYVYDKGYTDKTHLTIETLSGIKKLDLQVRSGKVKSVTVDMGRAEVGEDMELMIDGNMVHGTPVSVGNPHFVIFVREIEMAPLRTVGPLIEKHAAFPDGVNVEFVQITGRKQASHVCLGARQRCDNGMRDRSLCECGGGCQQRVLPVKRSHICRIGWGTLEITVGNQYTVIMNGPAISIYEGETAI